jgi:hypothetical protein
VRLERRLDAAIRFAIGGKKFPRVQSVRYTDILHAEDGEYVFVGLNHMGRLTDDAGSIVIRDGWFRYPVGTHRNSILPWIYSDLGQDGWVIAAMIGASIRWDVVRHGAEYLTSRGVVVGDADGHAYFNSVPVRAKACVLVP